MIVSQNKVVIPDNCPEKCPGRSEPFSQGGHCHRCPIFNCRAVPAFDLIDRRELRETLEMALRALDHAAKASNGILECCKYTGTRARIRGHLEATVRCLEPEEFDGATAEAYLQWWKDNNCL